MIEENARVIKTAEKYIWVEVERRSGCSHCQSDNCTTSVLSKIFSNQKTIIKMENTLNLSIGDEVIIGLTDKILVKAALWAYLLPVISLISFAIAAQMLGFSDLIQCFSGLTGLALSFLLIQDFFNQDKVSQGFNPLLLKKLPAKTNPVYFIKEPV